MRGPCRIGVLLAAAVALATTLIVPGSAVAAQPAFLYMGSQPGEYIGDGAEWSYTHENARFQAGRLPADPSSISIRIDETSDGHGPWGVEFGAPQGRPLVPGRYVNADKNAFRERGYPGIDVSGDGRGGTVNGRFVVREAEFSASGEVVRFRASFVQYFGHRLAALYGVVGIGLGAQPVWDRRSGLGVRRVGVERHADRAGPGPAATGRLRGSAAKPVPTAGQARPRRRGPGARVQHAVRAVHRQGGDLCPARLGPEAQGGVRAALRVRRPCTPGLGAGGGSAAPWPGGVASGPAPSACGRDVHGAAADA